MPIFFFFFFFTGLFPPPPQELLGFSLLLYWNFTMMCLDVGLFHWLCCPLLCLFLLIWKLVFFSRNVTFLISDSLYPFWNMYCLNYRHVLFFFLYYFQRDLLNLSSKPPKFANILISKNSLFWFLKIILFLLYRGNMFSFLWKN